MQETLLRICLTLLEGLKRLWQRLTRRPQPVPVRVRARYTTPFSLHFTDPRSPIRAQRHRPEL